MPPRSPAQDSLQFELDATLESPGFEFLPGDAAQLCESGLHAVPPSAPSGSFRHDSEKQESHPLSLDGLDRKRRAPGAAIGHDRCIVRGHRAKALQRSQNVVRAVLGCRSFCMTSTLHSGL